MDDIPKIPEREITPPALYFNRRSLFRAGLAAGSVIGTASLYRWLNPSGVRDVVPTAPVRIQSPKISEAELLSRGWRVNEPMTPEASIRSYNNFYEFTTDKEGVAAAAAKFKTDGWRLVVDGMVHKPRAFGIDDLRRSAPLRSAFIGCGAWKPGRWSFLGPAFLLRDSWKLLNR